MIISLKPETSDLTANVKTQPNSLHQREVEKADYSQQLRKKNTVPEQSQTENTENKEQLSSKQDLEALTKKLDDFVASSKRNISFSIDDQSGKTVVKLLDSENNVLRQIPSEEVLNLLHSLEKNKGLFLEDRA